MYFFSIQSLKRKFILIILLVSFIVITVGLSIVFISNIYTTKKIIQEDLTTSAHSINKHLITKVIESNSLEIKSSMIKHIDYNSIALCVIYDHNNKIIFSNNYTKEFEILPYSLLSNKEIQHHFNYVEINLPIIYNNKIIGATYIVSSKNTINDIIRKNIYLFLFLIIFLLPISYFLASIFQRSILNPIIHLAEVTKNIVKEEDYSIRLTTTKKDEIGTLFNSFNSMVQHIQDRKRERDSALEKIKENELKLTQLIDMIPLTIYETDVSGNFTFLNESGKNSLGFSNEDLKKDINIADVISPEHLNKARERIKKMITEKKYLEPTEYIVIKKNKEKINVINHSNPILKEGRPIGVRGVILDITQRISFENELKQAYESLEEMIYVASHDLQVPLVSMEGYASELIDTYKDVLDDNGIFYLTRLKTNAHRMHKLVISLLNISKLSTKKPKLEYFNPETVVHKITFDLSLAIEKLKVSVEINKMPDIYGDKQRIETVFRNLITNSLNYKSKNIIIGFLNDKYFVKDDGLGIPDGQHSKIFNPGERLKISENDGIGMGLTFCKKIIQQHNGKIWAESDGNNTGTSIFFSVKT